jgi:hypothetical protein
MSEPNLTSVPAPTVKALTLWQPWATLMALGVKRNETRGWSTTHRGSLAIHASTHKSGWGRKGTTTALTSSGLVRLQDGDALSDVLRERCFTVEYDGALLLRSPGLRPYRLPLGCVVAIVDVYDVKRTDSPELRPDETEQQLGDYHPGRFAWQTGSRRVVPTSWHSRTAATGRQGLWDWELPAGLDEQLPYPLSGAA